MYSLFIDTHSALINLVLYKDGKVVKKVKKETFKSHSAYILPMIKELLDNQEVLKNEIEELIVVNGPGSFTGVRLGITIAKTWAFSKNISIKSLSSLEVLAISINTKIKKVAIPDPKGYYTGIFDENNIKQEEFKYVKKDKLDRDFILEDDIKIDYELVYKFMKKLPKYNPHQVNPIYIKKIGVENGS